MSSRVRVISACAVPVLTCWLGACGGAQTQATLSYGESARRDFERAQAAVDDHDCLTAAPLLQHVRREYPYSRYAALAELRSADCELEQQHYTEAIRGYRAFIRQRPTHPEVDSANFAIAQAYFRQIPQDFFLSPPPEERDQASTRSALRVVRRFVTDHPESEHVEEARRIERQVLALLARHELYVANYYLRADHGVATIARIQTLLEDYEGSGVEPEALLLMGQTYLHMRQPAEAGLAFQELIERFGDSGYAAQGRSYLVSMGVAVSAEGAAGAEGADGAQAPGAEGGAAMDDAPLEGAEGGEDRQGGGAPSAPVEGSPS